MKIQFPDSRLEAFSDAVFAFAATLLVVSLEVPENFTLLKEQLSGFFSFGISFFALVMIWKTHYNFFRRTDYLDNIIIAANMFLLFVVLYFVYPLKFLANQILERTSMTQVEVAELFELYSLGFSLIFFSLSIMYWWAGRKDPDQGRRSKLQFYARHFTIFWVVGLFSILIAFLEVGIPIGLPGMIYTLLGPLCYFHGVRFGYDEPETNTA